MKMTWLRAKSPFWSGFIAGLGAGIIASGVMLLLSIYWQGVSLPEVFGSVFTALMPPPLFDYLHQTIGADAKHILFYGILVGQCLVFGVCGGIFNQRVNAVGDALRLRQGLLLALILWLVAGLILLPLTGAGFFGAALSSGLLAGLLSLAVVGLVFGMLFVLIYNWMRAAPIKEEPKIQKRERLLKEQADGRYTRRALIRDGALVIGAAAVGLFLWNFIVNGAPSVKVPVSRFFKNYKKKIVPPPVPNYGPIAPAPFLSPEITSNDQFYQVSKNLSADPTVNASGWTLTVDGQVEHPFTLNYQEALAQPMKQQYESLMCISNEVGGPYMSNALWEGIPLGDLLQRAGVKPGATKVVFHAADDYADSIHLSKALEPTTLIAFRMNGAALPQEHGFPARMLVPGIYGMKHCKWLTHIEVVNYDFQGYWQQRGWSDEAPVRMTSRIDTPLDGSTIKAHRVTYIAGVAFSGNKGISEVDVSTDSGTTWERAVLKQPLSNLTWVLWEYAWTPPKTGSYIISVRAIDLEGNVQDPTEEPPVPNGSSGYHSISINAS
jgi:DMSO/TMAO reductase YedYZ molybdopterin-dependent catalytic subunit